MVGFLVFEDFLILLIRLNKSRKPSLKLAAAKSVSKRYNFISSQRLADLCREKLKKKTASKMNWGVVAYGRWRQARLKEFPNAVIADLEDIQSFTKDAFVNSMCYFIPEVVKQNGDLYPGPSLYQMCVAIQKYLNFNKIPWKIVEGEGFEDIKVVLDNVMKEHTQMGVGTGKKIAKLITYEMEQDLWNRNYLGSDSPDKLRTTVFYLIGLRCMLRGVGEHYNLRRDMPNKKSQISFECDSSGVRCLVYREDFVTKTHDGGLRDMRHDRKVVWVHPNIDNPDHCPVALTDKYIGLCPPDFYKKENFYLQSRAKPNLGVWYNREVLGENSIGRTGTSRLFQAGVQRKIVKECSGHTSDAVDNYQITSDHQRQCVSKILQGKPVQLANNSKVTAKEVMGTAIDSVEPISQKITYEQCSDKSECKCKTSGYGGIIEQIMSQVNASGKAKIKIEIEVSKE